MEHSRKLRHSYTCLLIRSVALVLGILTVNSAVLAQGTWVQKAGFAGYANCNEGSFSIGNKGFLISGIQMWEYDPALDQWTQRASLTNVSSNMAAFTIGNYGYVGAIYGTTDFLRYDPVNNVWTPKASYPGIGRQMACGFAVNGKGYIMTGMDDFGSNYMAPVWEYDPVADAWTQKGNFPGPLRAAAVAFTIGQRGYMGTGVSGVLHSDFWEYNPTNDTWTQKANFGGGIRSEATGFSIGDFGYIGLGTTQIGFGDSSDFWQYNPANDSWTRVAGFGGGIREFASGFSIGCKGYVGMGWINDNGNTYLNDLWEYTPDTCEVTAIREYYDQGWIRVFPTVFHDYTTIAARRDLENATIRIFSTSGETALVRENISGKLVILERGNLPAGIYLMEISEANVVLSQHKLVIAE